jgi:hypothetical protein
MTDVGRTRELLGTLLRQKVGWRLGKPIGTHEHTTVATLEISINTFSEALRSNFCRGEKKILLGSNIRPCARSD